MRKAESDASLKIWDSVYAKRKFPWRSGGLGKLTLHLLANHTRGKRLLEIGCGTGDDSVAIVESGFAYHGLDFSPVAIRSAKRHVRHKNITFTCADFFEWLPAEPFDVIYEKGFFHGLAGARRRNTFVRRVASQLEPNGLWVSVCGAADEKHDRFPHGAIYLRDLVGPAQVYFEILEIIKGRYGLADESRDFQAWYSAFRRY